MTISADKHDTIAAGLMRDILHHAQQRGWSQGELAERASVPESSISRIKRTGRADLGTLANLAGAVGLRLTLLPDSDFTEKLSRGDLF